MKLRSLLVGFAVMSLTLSLAPARASVPMGLPPVISSRSGVIPEECLKFKMTGSPYLLDCWLNANPKVAHAIVWSDHNRNSIEWANWEDWRKATLRDTFLAATKWYTGGMLAYTATRGNDVPVNHEEPWFDTDYFTVLDEGTDAWPLFAAHVAFSLAAEINGWVPWSLRGYDSDSLFDLLSAEYMFRYTGNDYYHSEYPGYIVMYNSTPTHPIVTLQFLRNNHLIGGTSRQTLVNVLEWARENLNHFFVNNPNDPIDYQVHFWQYKGAPPVARVLSGTICSDPSLSSDMHNLRHWTDGCSGTTDFLTWLLRVVNIPVRRSSQCGHTMPYFSGEKAYLSHGDDPYNQLSKGAPAEMLLVDPNTWHTWIEAAQNGSCSQVDRNPKELSLTYLPDTVVGYYCADTRNGLDHAHGQVYNIYHTIYSVQELEAKGLWTRLADEVPTSTDYRCLPLHTN